MNTIKGIAIIIGIALVLLIGYGLIEPRLLAVEEEVAEIPNLPEDWEDQEIAVLGDFQIGMWLDNPDTVEKAVEEIIERDPAAVLMLGDFIYHPQNETQQRISQNIEALKPIGEAGIPVYSVMGNHDFGLKEKDGEPLTEAADKMRKALKDIGVEILHNESTLIDAEGAVLSEGEAGLFIAGVGSNWMDEDNAAQALEGIPTDAPRVVMMHNPNSFEKFPANSAPLAVAGHTHGGQIRMPGMTNWSWMAFVSEEDVHTDGWVEDYGAAGNELYVNRGIGMSAVPIRINAKPELTMFTLVSEE